MQVPSYRLFSTDLLNAIEKERSEKFDRYENNKIKYFINSIKQNKLAIVAAFSLAVLAVVIKTKIYENFRSKIATRLSVRLAGGIIVALICSITGFLILKKKLIEQENDLKITKSLYLGWTGGHLKENFSSILIKMATSEHLVTFQQIFNAYKIYLNTINSKSNYEANLKKIAKILNIAEKFNETNSNFNEIVMILKTTQPIKI